MDNPQMKERNYRLVNTLRLKNQRENRLLHDRIYSKQGLHSSYMSEMQAVSKEQERIRKELSTIRQTITTTWGVLPARGQQPDASRDSDTMNIEYMLYGRRGNGRKVKKKKKTRKNMESVLPEVTQNPEMKNSGKTDDKTHNKNTTGTRLPVLDATDHTDGSLTDMVETNVEKPIVHLDPLPENQVSSDQMTSQSIDNDMMKADADVARENAIKRLTGTSDHATSTKQKVTKKPSRSVRPKLTPIDEQQGHDETSSATVNSSERRPPATNTSVDLDNVVPSAPQTSTKSKKSRESNLPQFDRNQYNPDGSIRTVHKMDDMDYRLTEAKKARYIRHKELLERERELSINEILGRDPSRGNSLPKPIKI